VAVFLLNIWASVKNGIFSLSFLKLARGPQCADRRARSYYNRITPNIC